MAQTATEEAAKAATPCVSCGAKLRVDAKFCDKCGTSVRTSGSPAPFGARYAAFLVDLTVVMMIWFIASIVLQPFIRMLPESSSRGVEIGAFTATVGSIIGIIMLPVVAIVYIGLADAWSRTIGKRIVGIRVQRRDMRSAGLIRSLARALVLWGPILLMVLGNLFDLYGSRSVGLTIVRIGAPLALIAWPATLIMVAASKRRRGLDDVIAGTETVRD
ncbi:MAG TPA: RDD family protein [Actinomycetota bacterium]|nr:RDD family protein [Actinomycetota bacterium]